MPTTGRGYPYPDDSGLVTSGALAIKALAEAVDALAGVVATNDTDAANELAAAVASLNAALASQNLKNGGTVTGNLTVTSALILPAGPVILPDFTFGGNVVAAPAGAVAGGIDITVNNAGYTIPYYAP